MLSKKSQARRAEVLAAHIARQQAQIAAALTSWEAELVAAQKAVADGDKSFDAIDRVKWAREHLAALRKA